jgi:hypothetical protein
MLYKKKILVSLIFICLYKVKHLIMRRGIDGDKEKRKLYRIKDKEKELKYPGAL